MAVGQKPLSFQETQIAFLLRKSKRPKEIAFRLGIATSTVWTIIERIKKKLGLGGTREIAVYFAEQLAKQYPVVPELHDKTQAHVASIVANDEEFRLSRKQRAPETGGA